MKRPKRKKNSGFTLIEVMMAMFWITVMCLSAFVGLRQISNVALSVAVRDEAYHLMQDEAERLLSAPYSSFTATSDSPYSSVKTSFVPSTVSPLTLPAAADNNNLSARVLYTRAVTVVSSSTSSTTLQVQVSWTWQKHSNSISTVLLRTP